MVAAQMEAALKISSHVWVANANVVGLAKSVVRVYILLVIAIILKNAETDFALILSRRRRVDRRASSAVMAACVLIAQFATRKKISAGRAAKITKSVAQVARAQMLDWRATLMTGV